MTSGVDVRRAGPADVDALLTLVAEYCAADGHDFDADVVRAGLDPLLADDRHGTVWLIDDDDGYAVATWGWSLEIGGFEVVLDELYVRTKGCGRGGVALDRVEADCRERGARRIFLETERPNRDARRLYARHGYVEDDSVWMSKELT